MITIKNTTKAFMNDLNLGMPPLQTKYGEGLMGEFFLVFFVLLSIIAFIFITFKFLSKKSAWTSNGLIKHLGGVRFSQQKSIQVIEFGGEIYLIGVGEEVQLIDKIDEKEKVEHILGTMNSKSTSINMVNIKDIFSRLKKNKGQEPHHDHQTNTNFHDVFYEKMNTVKKRNQEISTMFKNDNNKDREKNDD
ncbi:flagellar biosynthetic protein FliO [Chengkuizengella axinellae]|uniref:Flagellar biosynthetic protein FliO n=1 Tax=Chengkuizengella axinellae TaxID=3064388 RepID=A0ABT9IWH6_9BACL|nr:flagellar biosynthetic protein FliO [Chengkuizengella sp. 2205SS18-9]MDP5273452.1 flagellar biosynthetic protein FliO [Chengkuizengella sp. 2205SS18-9]